MCMRDFAASKFECKHYSAESFRYSAAQISDLLPNIKNALPNIKLLCRITFTNAKAQYQ